LKLFDGLRDADNQTINFQVVNSFLVSILFH